MGTFLRFEDIEAWRKARLLTREVYVVSGRGQFSRDYGLRDQIRRACASIMSNIAEGFERDGNSEFAHFLSIAKASTAEVRSQLYVALDQGYIDRPTFDKTCSLCNDTTRLIGGLMAYLRSTDFRGSKFTKPKSPR